MLSLLQIILLLLDILWFLLLAHLILSWLVSFQVLNLRQPLVAQFWMGLNRVMEPIYRPVRRFLPPAGGLDFAPLIVLIAVYILRIVIVNNASAFV